MLVSAWICSNKSISIPTTHWPFGADRNHVIFIQRFDVSCNIFQPGGSESRFVFVRKCLWFVTDLPRKNSRILNIALPCVSVGTGHYIFDMIFQQLYIRNKWYIVLLFHISRQPSTEGTGFCLSYPVEVLTVANSTIPQWISEIKHRLRCVLPISAIKKSSPSKMLSLYTPEPQLQSGSTLMNLPFRRRRQSNTRRLVMPLAFIKSSSRISLSRSPPCPVDPSIAPPKVGSNEIILIVHDNWLSFIWVQL